MAKKSFAYILIIFIMTVTIAGCSVDFGSLFIGTGNSSSNQILPPNPNLPNRIEYNVIPTALLSDIQSAENSADYEEYTNIKKVLGRIQNSIVTVSVTTKTTSNTASGVVIGVDRQNGNPSGLETSANPTSVKDSATSASVSTSQTPTVSTSQNSSVSTWQSNSQSVPTEGKVTKSYIACSHAQIEGAFEIKVTTAENATFTAKFVGSDPDSGVSVISVETDLTPVTFYNNSDNLEVGETLIALNPVGVSGSAYTSGILSSALIEKTVGGQKVKFMQTDVRTNESAMGGGLFTSTGFFVGLINPQFSSLASVDGLTVALCSNTVLSFTKQLVETSTPTSNGYINGKYRLGFSVTNQYGSYWGTIIKVQISALEEDGALYLAELRVGDVIKSINYKNQQYVLTTATEFEEYIASLNLVVGDELTFNITRGEVNRTVLVRVLQYVYEN